jgi:hypothetical protein
MTTLISYGVAFVVIWLTLIACASVARWAERRRAESKARQAVIEAWLAEEDRKARERHMTYRRKQIESRYPRDYE